MRGQPWYRRSPRIILEDLLYPLRVWLKERKDKREEDRKRAQRSDAQPPVIGMYFVDPHWNDRPALDHLDGYLKSLQALVNDCESRFLPQPGAEGA